MIVYERPNLLFPSFHFSFFYIQVDAAIAGERERLEMDQKAAVDRLQQKHNQELETLKQDAERKHKEQVRTSVLKIRLYSIWGFVKRLPGPSGQL
jgi:hypothetical protein